MSKYLNFIEKWPLKKDISPQKKLILLRKALVLMDTMWKLDTDNRDYWIKRENKIWGLIRETEGEIIRLEIEGKELLKETI